MIKIYMEKVVSDWNNETGAGLKAWVTMFETIILKEKETITEALANYGLNFDEFEDVTEDTEPEDSLHRRYDLNRIEDGEGNPTEQGLFVADYIIHIHTYKEIKTEEIKK